MLCSYCGKAIDETKLSKTVYYRNKRQGWGYCCRECARKGIAEKNKKNWTDERREAYSEMMSKNNKKHSQEISERMKLNNPMKKLETQKKVSERLREIGHHPKIRCGNGAGLTVPQQILMLELAKTQEVYAEYPIPTKMQRESGYPACYKVDIAMPSLMIAIEVDGMSHCAIERQNQDKKKTAFLTGLGWKVLRFKNTQVTEHLTECVQTVMSIISK